MYIHYCNMNLTQINFLSWLEEKKNLLLNTHDCLLITFIRVRSFPSVMVLTPSNRSLKSGKIKYIQVAKIFSLLMDLMHLGGGFFEVC